MTEQLGSVLVGQVLASLGLADSGSLAIVIVAPAALSVLWANDAARDLSGTAAGQDMTRLLFGLSPAARSFAARLRRVVPGQPPQLERLMVGRGWPMVPRTVACHAVQPGGTEPLVVLCFDASERAAKEPRAAAGVGESIDVVPQSPAPDAISAVDAQVPRVRVLWDTDENGIVTQVGAGFRLAVGSSALAVGDHLPSRLRAFAPSVATQFDTALVEQGSVGLWHLLWPGARSERTVPTEIGCAYRRGSISGLRGFCLIHVDRAWSVQDPDADLDRIADVAPEAPAYHPGLGTISEASEQDVGSVQSAETLQMENEPASDLQDPESVALSGADAPMPRLWSDAARGTVGGSNIVHFPGLRIASVAANFAHELRSMHTIPSQKPANMDGDAVDLDAPLWSETPREDQTVEVQDQLTVDEQEAFAHIGKVLGTLPSNGPPNGFNEGERAEMVAPRTVAFDLNDVLPLTEALPVGVLMQRDGVVEANRVFLDRLGYTTVDDFKADRTGPEDDPLSILAQDGTPVAAQAQTITLGGAATRLLIIPNRADQGSAEPVGPEVLKPDHAWQSAALEIAADGYAFFDPAGVVVWGSPGAARLFGYEEGGMIGTAVVDLLMSDQGPIWRTLLDGMGSADLESPKLLGRTRAGQPLPLRVRVGRVTPGTSCVVWTDDSHQSRSVNGLDAARREAERTSALKSEFLAKVSHEIRTPLNAILGFTEVIRDERLGPVGNSRYLDYLKDIHSSGTHVMSLVNDLLDLSRIEAGRMDLQLDAVDANAIVQACVNSLQTQAHRERIIMRLSLAPRLPPALADERSLRQIVLNLLSNAVKFNEPGGQVIVSTALADGDALAIRIRDTGIGMTDDEMATAMEPFRQVSTVKRTGSGLGLPLTKALVEANCASLSIKSTPGEGTLVEVIFPVVEQDTMSLPAE